MNVQKEPFSAINAAPSAKRVKLRGLFAGTKIAVEHGWVSIENLAPGDKVWTFDHGLQPIAGVSERTIRAEGAGATIARKLFTIPAGTLTNEEELVFLPSEGLLLECENASDMYGDPFAVVPVAALEGVCGIDRGQAPVERKLIRMTFAQDEAVYIDSGLIVFCPLGDAPAGPECARYDVKPLKAAKALITDLDLAELAVREADESFRVSFETPAETPPQLQETAGMTFPSISVPLRKVLGLEPTRLRQLLVQSGRTVRKSFGSPRPTHAADQGK